MHDGARPFIMRMHRLLLFTLALSAGGFAHAASTTKPNIVFLLSDDSGYIAKC